MPVETKDTFKTIKYVKDTPKLKETMINKEDNEITINNLRSPKVELIPNNNDVFEEHAKLFDKNNKKLTIKTRRRVDTSNTTVFPIK